MNRPILYFLAVLVLASCSAKKFLPEGELYFAGHEFEYQDSVYIVPDSVKNDLVDELKPKPNGKIFASRPGVWLYNVVDEPKKDKGLKYTLKYKWGEEPVYLSDVDLDRNQSFVSGYLANNGFFNATTDVRIDSSKYEAKVIYEVKEKRPYKIDTLILDIADDFKKVEAYLTSGLKKSQLKPGTTYSQEGLENERQRLSNYLRTQGYYYFQPEYLLFLADSSLNSHKVMLHLTVKETTPTEALQQYAFGDIYVYLGFDPTDTVQAARDTTMQDSLTFIYKEPPVMKPKKLARYIHFEPGEVYNSEEHNRTIYHLNGLDVFQFVNTRFNIDPVNPTLLHPAFYLSMRPKKSITTEVTLSTNSNHFTGPGVQVEFLNRNALRGAERLVITGTGSYEVQLSGERKGLSTYELGLNASLLIPRYYGPFSFAKSSRYIPYTKFSLDYRLYSQPLYYSQNSFTASYGYQWQETKFKRHELNLVEFTYIELLKTSDVLDSLLESNLLFRESFTDQIIFGPSYTFTYSNQTEVKRKVNNFFQFSLGLSGNVLSLANKALDSERNEDGAYELFSVQYAQYTRAMLDNRFYFHLDRRNTLVFRQKIGAGIPYGNSNTLPFSKQFYVGGANSLRGFQIRSVGPGTYYEEDQQFAGFFSQTGEAVLETNLEFRYSFNKVIKGAAFVDAGNVWLINNAEAWPGGKFEAKDFMNELAVDGGIGLRIDVSILVLRLDLGMPLRKPYLPDGDRWVFDKIDFGSKDWRRDNLLLSIAIGYPF